MKNRINQPRFNNMNILLVGDFFLDEYVLGKIYRQSPEANVPILNIKDKKINLGGAGNVLNNLINLGASVSVLGKVGNDYSGTILQDMINKKKINKNLISIEKNEVTIKKTRVINDKNQLIRIDDEQIYNIGELSNNLKRKIKSVIKKSSLVIISDYGKGFCTKNICQFIIKYSNKKNIKVIVDPRKNFNDYEKYVNADFITPNLNELRLLFPKLKNNNRDIFVSSKKIINKYKIKNVITTRSEKGISFTNENMNINIKTNVKKVFDVSGAGDTVVAVFSILFILNKSIEECLKISNKCAGVVISKRGTVPIKNNEFKKFLKKKL
jgi:rfaE bifunctional protein kinase chain/domain